MDIKEQSLNTNRHPWEISRANRILNIMARSMKGFSFVDIGAGDLYFSSLLQSITDIPVVAVDNAYTEGYTAISGLICIDDISKLESSSFDCAILMDVLEHIEDDHAFFARVLDLIKDNGTIVITVPAHQCLYSDHDTFLEHFRRYKRQQIIDLMRENGVDIDICHYFYSSLFFVRLAEVICGRTGIKAKEQERGIGGWNYSQANIVTKILVSLLDFDFQLCSLLDKCGIRIPGLSIIAICRKIA